MSLRITKKKLTFIILAICIISVILFFTFDFSFTGYLSKTEKVDANLLIVEGWLPPYAIELACTEFRNNNYDRIITTGIKNSEYFLVYTDGYLIFHTQNLLKAEEDKTAVHVFEVDAYSELGGQNSAHFNVLINDSPAAGFSADKKKRKYDVQWKGNLSSVDSVMVQFDNDLVNEYGDRNLFVKEVIIDHKIHIPFQNYSEYDIPEPNGIRRFKNNYSSFAGLARNRLLSSGLDSSLVLAIPGERVRINRTLTSVLAFRDWLKNSGINVKGINIITMGTHARRTWMTYNKVLDKKYPIGIISLPDYVYTTSEKRKFLKTLRETLGIIYYWVLLIPY